MRALLIASIIWLFATAASAQPASPTPPQPLPRGVELPIEVKMSVRVLDVTRIQEVLGEVSGLVEFTQLWHDPSLRFDRISEGRERIDLVGAEAEWQLARIWSPGVAVENLIGVPRAQTMALSLFYDGRVALIRRIDANFRVQLGLGAFPFDRQTLALRFASQRHAATEVALVSTELDRQQSGIERSLSAANWRAAALSFRQESFFGWNARPYSRLVAAASVDRNWPRYILQLFIPFFALMSLSLFLLSAPERVIPPSSRAAMIFSALLALAALSFTFESSFPGSISLNSPVATMISLGYFYLPLVLLVDLLLSQQDTPLTSRYPALLPEARRNLRLTLPLLFFGLCILLLLTSGDEVVRLR